jgi:primosomal protein N' (replication factor Y) (superfamily II helicase)
VFAEIIIPLALPKNYTWSIPDSLLEQARPGCRVEVVLGKNKKYAGIIKRLHHEHPAEFEVKDILSVLDPEPIISEKQFELWEWIAKYYMCSEGEAMAAALPAHFKLSSETVLIYNEEAGEDFSMLDANEYLVAEALLIKKELRMSELSQILDEAPIYPVVKRLIEKRICFVWEALKQTYTEKKETFVLLNPQYSNEEKLAELMNNWGRAQKQLELLLAYIHLSKTQGDVTKSELLKKSGASEAQLKALADKNILILEKRSVDRLKYLPRDINIDFTLTPSQEEALGEVQSALQQKQVCLLHGATSSGKTLIYIRLIEELIRQGKQALYLLPEIALTSQIIRRLQKYFGGYIGIYHSKFSQNERVEIWNKVRSGELKVILGARSSLFLPFVDLGLVIIDEEHDVSFKQQDPAPRYNARDAAVYYASLYDAKVVMGSATPSIETFYNGRTGKYGLVQLSERYGGTSMPEINIIDLSKRLYKNKERLIITPELEEEIKKTVANGKQVILFQNRRGYAPYQICQVCGWIPHCRYCDVTLTYHKQSHKLHCHYCGTLYPPLHSCLRCGSDRFLHRNFGTEKIEEQLDEIFTEARVARMDVDTVRGKNAHDNLIQLFEQQRIDILVGTQMVVKGLDFEQVQLVGVLDADSLLGFADFRVNERAFQLMEQVSGRSGRKGDRGKVMIQVADTRHPVLQYVQHHDYLSLYASEIEARNRFFYPPYSRLILLTCKHVIKDVATGAAARLAEALTPAYGKYLVGPAEPVVNRVRNQFLMELMLKLPKDGQVVRECKQFILELIAILHSEKKFRSVVITPDVDPL